MDRGLFPEDRIRTIHYGIDPRPFDQAVKMRESVRDEWGMGASDLVVGAMSRMDPQKDLATLIRAFAKFRDGIKTPSKLVLVGRGSLEKDLRALAAAEGVAASVVWAGFREDIPAVLHAFDVFALSSVYEGFGLVLLEAMAAGKPVVATRVSAIPEVVAEGVSGILTKAGDAEMMAEALIKFSDPGLRNSFGAAGRRRVEAKFSLSAMEAKTAEVYTETLSEASFR
jgi:glycosyltransferase involved in cell wall biosynthesis